MNKKIIWGVIVIAVLVVVGWTVFFPRYTKLERNTYTNNKYGFSFKYPVDWTIKSDSYAVEGGYYNIYLDREGRKTNSAEAPLLGLRIYEGVKDLGSFGAFKSLIGEHKATTVVDSPAEEILGTGQNGKSSISIAFVKNGNGYIMSSFDSEGEPTIAVARSILSTIDFLAPPHVTPATSNWKTYSNPELGFTLEYPAGTVITADSDARENTIRFKFPITTATENSKQLIVSVETARQCSDNSLASSATINGVLFSKIDASEAATAQRASITRYCASRGNTAYNILSMISYARLESTSDGFNPAINVNNDAVLNKMVASFKFTSSEKISSKPTITILSPNGGEVWKIGQKYTVTFTSNAQLGLMTVALARYSDDGVIVGSSIIGTTNTNSLSYTVPQNIETTRGNAARYKIEVYPATARELVTRSANYFTITN